MLDWELVLKSAAAVIATALSLLQLVVLLSRRKQRLKIDLEILKLLDNSAAEYGQVSSAVDAQVAAIYGGRDAGWRRSFTRKHAVATLFNATWAVGFAYLTFRLHASPEPTLWLLVSGYLTLTGS